MAVHLLNCEFTATLSEAAGFKTGIVLDKSQLIELFPDNSSFKEKLAMPDDAVIRVYSYDIDEIFIQILYYLGNVERVTSSTITERLLHKYKADKQLFPIYMEIFELFVEHNKIMLDDDIRNFTKLMNQEKFIADCVVKYGRTGLNIAAELLRGKSEDMHCKLSSYRRFEWDDAVDLKELFQSESLESKYGEFIDQRFIDFLYKNQDKLGEMHWRKFEGLTAEFFDRQGYKVELGPGRNDGGIDVRVWKDDADETEAPLLLVQCKRHKHKIDRTVVKALWADVQWEKASSGLIVTTSSLSPGASNDCVARGYNIEQADKVTVGQWLENMRTPGNGVFMGK